MSNILEKRNVTGNPDIDFKLQGEKYKTKMALKFLKHVIKVIKVCFVDGISIFAQ